MAAIYRVGERVDGLYDENTDEMWYPGRIRCVHQSEDENAATFEVLYDDGEVEMNVRSEFLRPHVSGTICVGTRVLSRYDGGDEFYPGQISDVQENGKYTIAYDDGEVEEDVPIEYIKEPKEGNKEQEEAENEKKVPSDAEPEQQQEEDVEVEEPQENEPAASSDPQRVFYSSNKREPQNYVEFPQPAHQNEEDSKASSTEVSAERVYIIDSLDLLEKRLGDAASAKSVLSTLVKHMRAYPQVTADLVHERGSERLIIDSLKFHQSHAVIQCYGFVLLRRLCFLCVKSTHFLLRNGIVELVIQAMNAFTEDAILQASACGALAVFTRVHAGLNSLIEFQVAQLVLSTLIYHKTYSVHTRQVHYYGCEVLLELCELDDLQTLSLLCGEQEEEFTGEMSPISLLLFLLRQGLSLDDKKACCAVGSLLMCLAASGKRAAASVLSLNGLSELSTVMSRYPTEPSIQKYSAAASKQIALCSVRQSPTKRIKDTATEILREAESLENTPMATKPLAKKSVSRRSTGTGKRKKIPSSGYGASSHPRGTAYSSSTYQRNTQAFSKVSSQSPYRQPSTGDMNAFSYPVRDYSAPQQPSSLVILDGGFGVDSGFNSTHKRRQSREDRQNELFEAYGVQGIPSAGRSHGTKRRQLRAHLASAESTWASPHSHGPSSIKPLSSRSSQLDHDQWGYENEEPINSTYDPEARQPRGAKRKKKNPGVRSAFQVKVESENQLLVSRQSLASHPSPQRLGAATKRAAKARQKRISATNHSSMTARSNNPSSESLNEYATHLFQDNVAGRGANYMASSRLTPREKEEIRERERLSFAEKLHKMIDKAKSSLANGNTTSMSVDSVHWPQKSSAGSKTARKARDVSVKFSEDTHPKAKKTRAMGSSTPKQFTDMPPQEAIKARPAKPTSGSSKRVAVSSDAPSGPVVSRPKPVVSRAVVTPKPTADSKPRPAAMPAAKPTDKQEAEKPNESVGEHTPEINESSQVEVDAAAESVEISAPPTAEPKSTDQIEPARSDTDAKVDAIPPADESQVEPGTVGDKEAVANGEGDDTIKKDAEEVPAEVETVNAAIDVPAATEEETRPGTTVNATLSPEDVQHISEPPLEEPSAPSEPTDDQPSGRNAEIDAMYGDAFNEFDDNGGDDEEITVEAEAGSDEAEVPVAETVHPPKDMQMSKSGEALYDDGYDDFDEDEPYVEEAEAEDAPAATEATNDEEPTNTTTKQSVEITADPVADLVEVEDKQVAEEEPSVAEAGEPETAASAEQGEGDEELQLDANVDERDDDVAVDPSSGEVPVASNFEEEQKPADLGNDPVAEPCEPEDGIHADPEDTAADEKTDIDTPSDNVGNGASDGGDGEEAHEHEAEPTSSTSAVEPVGDTQSSAQPEDDTSIASAPTEDASIEPPTVEATLSPAQPQHDEEKPVKETVAGAQEEEPLTSDVAASSLAQEEESKQMAAGNSVASIHSAVYDEHNFDDEEGHQEVKPSETAEEDPVPAPVEKTVEAVDQEQQEAETLANTEVVALADTSPDAVSRSEGEDEPKPLAPNTSEASVQSAVYDDEGFEDGAHEALDHSGDKALEEGPSGTGVADNATVDTPSEPVPLESGKDVKSEDEEAPAAITETYGAEEFDNPEQDDATEGAAESLANEKVEVPPQQPESSESTPESETVADPPSAVAETEEPDAKAQEETQSAQEPVGGESEENNDDAQVENATSNDDDDVSAAPAAYDEDNFDDEEIQQEEKPSEAEVDSVSVDQAADQQEQEDETPDNTRAAPESSGPVPVSSESSADPIESEIEVAIPPDNVVAQEEDESPAQPEAYGDDEFDKGAEEEAAANATTEELRLVPNDEVPQGEDVEIPASEQLSDEVADPVATETDSSHEPVAVEEVSPESEAQTISHPEQTFSEDAVDSSAVPDAVDGSVSEVKPASGVAAEIPSEDVGEQVESPTEDGANLDPASDIVDNSVLEMAPSESEPQANTSDEPRKDQNDSFIDVSSDPENVADVDKVEPKAQSDKAIERVDKPDQSTDDTQEIAFDGDIPAPVDTVVAVESSDDTTQEETQYEDAEFDDAENATIALEDVVPKDEPKADEATTADSVSPDDSPPAQTEETEPMTEDSEVPTTKEEAVDMPAAIQVDEGAAEPSESVPDRADEQPTRRAAVEINDHVPSSVDQDTSNDRDTEVENKDEPAVSSSDAAAYEEDFPDDVAPETNENAPADATAASTESEAIDNDDTPAEAEGPAIDSKEAPEASVDVPTQPSDGVDAAPDSPSDEHYDEGFDEENTTPTVDASGYSNAVDGCSVAEADTPAPEGNSVPEASEDNVVAENEQLHHDEAPHDELDAIPVEHAALDEDDVKAEECDVANAAEADPVEAPAVTEQVALENNLVKPEAVESETSEPEAAQPEDIETQSEVLEPEAREAEPEAINPEGVEPGVNESEELTPIEPKSAEPKVIEPEATEPDAVESEAVVSGDAVAVPESTEENSITEPVLERPAALVANQDKPSELVSDGRGLPASETAIEASVDTATEINPQGLTEDVGATVKASEDAAQAEEASAVENEIDPSPSEDPVEDTASPTVDEPADVASDEPQEPAHLETGSTLEAGQLNAESAEDNAIDTVPQDTEQATDQSQSTGEVAKEVRDEPTSPDPAETTGEAQQDQAPVYTETADPAELPADEVKQEGISDTTEVPVQDSAEQENVEIPEVANDSAVEPQTDEVPPEKAQDTHLVDDQYDDDEGYNEFDEQDNEIKASISTPSDEVPAPDAPVVSEAPAIEDEYENERNEEFENDEEYENDDYGEEEMAAETPRADPEAPPSTHIEPPVSAREQEIEEVADAPDEPEDAYADDHDEYNEYEDDDAPAASKGSPPIEIKPTVQAEAFADEYEDDNEDEYADDVIEDNSPPKPAPAAPANKSDDEMEEELGYESDERYADSED